jgi:ribonucleotide reductase alpha subunit
LSGAISKTINLPEEATEKDISDAYLYGYDLGLKAIAVYRANSKAASVMFTNAEDLKNRTNIDLGTTSFDIKQIFRRAVGLDPEENSMRWMEELSEQPIIGQESEETSEEPCCQNGTCDMAGQLETPDYHCKDNECLMNVQAEAIEMPTYGCKDGVCSI